MRKFRGLWRLLPVLLLVFTVACVEGEGEEEGGLGEGNGTEQIFGGEGGEGEEED